jgi:hypothetical protein
MDQTRLPKITINWKPEGRGKRGHPRRTWKYGIYTAMSERDLRMGEWNNRRQWNMEVEGVVRRFKIVQSINQYIYNSRIATVFSHRPVFSPCESNLERQANFHVPKQQRQIKRQFVIFLH